VALGAGCLHSARLRFYQIFQYFIQLIACLLAYECSHMCACILQRYSFSFRPFCHSAVLVYNFFDLVFASSIFSRAYSLPHGIVLRTCCEGC
jgi:hypothetical protein